MHTQRAKSEQLIEEFHVQIYSNGRIDWDNLDAFFSKRTLDESSLLGRMQKRLSAGRPAPRHAAS